MIKTIQLFGEPIPIKNNLCTTNPCKMISGNCKFNLYIKVTDSCNAKCNYCSNAMCERGMEQIDLSKLALVIRELYDRDLLNRISLTGGEPLLYIDRLNDILNTVFDTLPEAFVTLNTNGINFQNIKKIETLDKIDGIHISRHHFNDDINNQIFGVKTASKEEIQDLFNSTKDKKLIRLNCLLMKDYIDSQDKVSEYLEQASEIGVFRVGFVSLMKVNDFCREHYINFNDILTNLDKTKYLDVCHFYDSTICECKNGLYLSKNGDLVEFYARMTKELNCDYTRAFVYTPANELSFGFNKKKILVPNKIQ